MQFLFDDFCEIYDEAWAVDDRGWSGVDSNARITYRSLQGHRETDVRIMKEGIGKLVLNNTCENDQTEPRVYL